MEINAINSRKRYTRILCGFKRKNLYFLEQVPWEQQKFFSDLAPTDSTSQTLSAHICLATAIFLPSAIIATRWRMPSERTMPITLLIILLVQQLTESLTCEMKKWRRIFATGM